MTLCSVLRCRAQILHLLEHIESTHPQLSSIQSDTEQVINTLKISKLLALQCSHHQSALSFLNATYFCIKKAPSIMLFASSRAGKLLLSCEINSRISTYVSCNTNQRFPRSPQYMLFTRGTTLFECSTIAVVCFKLCH